ncbi:MAG: methylmalonyl-CoA mutase family protein [Nitrospirae bacterium]|nr:methylmalonyl-CoA mutase family protein [Nitrospirota bacterium]
MSGIEDLKKTIKAWEDRALKNATEKLPNLNKGFTNLSNMEIDALYTPIDIEDLDYRSDLGFPGEFPFTRGIYPTMYRGRLWTMRQFAGFGSAEDTNKRFKYLLERGQTGLSVAFDMPTLMGLDSDHPMSAGEVGKCGVAVSSLEDMEVLFDGIPLDKVSTSMTINGPAAIIFAMYIVAAEKKGFPLKSLDGTIQNDILKEYIAQKEWLFPPGPSMRLITDSIEYSAENLPKWHPISISGYHIREAGSTALQELAFTISDGLTYVEACTETGLKIDEFAPALSFFFNIHNDFFEEIAKLRAARRIWAREIKRRYDPKDPRSLMRRCQAQTAGCSLTAQQPYNNVIRTTIQALAAVIGGVQSLHTNSMDETLALPTEGAVKIALRTQKIIAHESGVIKTVDPLGGSYDLEALTDKMEEGVYEYLRKIDEMGGMVKAIERGFPQREILDAALRYQREIDKKERVIVGMNEYQEEAGEPIDILRIDPVIELRQHKRLTALKQRRDNSRVSMLLNKLKEAARGEGNLMPLIIDAVRGYATLGEISDALKEIFGEYREPSFI